LADNAPPQPPPSINGTGSLVNIATRGTVGTDASILIGGFVIQGDKRTVLVRGIGPTLGSFGVAGALADPVITLFRNGTEAAVATNDDWGSAANQTQLAAAVTSTGAFALPAGSKDASMILTLATGSYTLHLTGKAGTTGVGLIEVYRVSP
jgi:hypothetical protein